MKRSAMAYLALLEDLANYALRRQCVLRIFFGVKFNVKPFSDSVPSSDPTELAASVTFSHAASFLLLVIPPALSEAKSVPDCNHLSRVHQYQFYPFTECGCECEFCFLCEFLFQLLIRSTSCIPNFYTTQITK